MSDMNEISDLSGLGPKSREMLARAGITTLAQLRELGSVAAYVQTRRCNPNASLNLLWGLESVLTGMHWREIARTERTRLLLMLEAYKDADKGADQAAGLGNS